MNKHYLAVVCSMQQMRATYNKIKALHAASRGFLPSFFHFPYFYLIFWKISLFCTHQVVFSANSKTRGEPQINDWLVRCINAEEETIEGKEMRACTHKRDNSCSSTINLEEHLVGIGLIIAEILLFMKWLWPIFSRSTDVMLLFPAPVASFWWSFGKNWSYKSRDITIL